MEQSTIYDDIRQRDRKKGIRPLRQKGLNTVFTLFIVYIMLYCSRVTGKCSTAKRISAKRFPGPNPFVSQPICLQRVRLTYQISGIYVGAGDDEALANVWTEYRRAVQCRLLQLGDTKGNVCG